MNIKLLNKHHLGVLKRIAETGCDKRCIICPFSESVGNIKKCKLLPIIFTETTKTTPQIEANKILTRMKMEML
jgi:hypothetical protein